MTISSVNGGSSEGTKLPSENPSTDDEDDFGEQESLENKSTKSKHLSVGGKKRFLVIFSATKGS